MIMWALGFFLQAFINIMIVGDFPDIMYYFTYFISYLALLSYLLTAMLNQGLYTRNMMVMDCENLKKYDFPL